MWYIIIGIIIIGVIVAILEAVWNIAGGILLIIYKNLNIICKNLLDAVGKHALIITSILCVIAFLAFSWGGVLVVAIGGLGIACILNKIGQALKVHDKSIKDTAKINQKTQWDRIAQQNEMALTQELDTNCRRLGFMNSAMWASKLPNYGDRIYQSSFDSITLNFAKQMEEQNILQNDDWFEAFFQYILDHPNGSTPTKLLNEVSCPQLQVTHITPDIELLEIRLKKGTQWVSRDVPPLFKEISLQDVNENLYVPTKYALNTYGSESNSADIHQNEMRFEDL